MKSRVVYYLLGVLMLAESGYLLYSELQRDVLSPNWFMVLSSSVLMFSLGYLLPHYDQKDERMRVIREKALSCTYFLILLYCMATILLLHFNIMQLSAIDTITVLIGFIMVTSSLSMVVLSKIV